MSVQIDRSDPTRLALRQYPLDARTRCLQIGRWISSSRRLAKAHGQADRLVQDRWERLPWLRHVLLVPACGIAALLATN